MFFTKETLFLISALFNWGILDAGVPVLAENGKTFVLKAGPEFEIIETNDLDELCIATPSIAQGKLFIRTASSVYCITNK